jgi:hypothetical protein
VAENRLTRPGIAGNKGKGKTIQENDDELPGNLFTLEKLG